ncbi:MAG: S-layer homology domain-containing protein [Caryophanon sp.]|nr:S-layer homology domain-containing protein [Caryophanon sp.]
MFKSSRNRYSVRNKVVTMLATVALTTSTVAPAAFAQETAATETQSVQFETYYKYATNSSSFAMLNTKPAIVEKTANGYNVTVQVSGYSIFTKFEIDGQQGVTGTSYEEDGTDRQGNPTKVTYTNVHFTFDSLDAVKKAAVTYTAVTPAGTFTNSHDFEVDFTPGEYNPSIVQPETYYKGETNSRHFSMLTSKPAKVVYASKKYNVTLDVSGYSIFTAFTMDGQQGVAGEAYTEGDTTFTPVTFTFDSLDAVKQATVAYKAGTRDMSHDFEIDFTPGEYTGAIEQNIESYYNYTTNSTHFSAITNKPAVISTKNGVSTVTLAVSGYDIFTKFEIDGQTGTVVSTFTEEGTDRSGKPTTITYSNVQFTFEDIKAAKDAVVAYKVNEHEMSHAFKLDFTPGEYKANEVTFETYYKGETNTASFKAVNDKPAIITVKDDKSYDVTLQVSGYDIFTKFEIDGQTGVVGETYTEKGTDRQGNETDVVYTYVTFNFKELASVKSAVLGYKASERDMSHEYELDFTPGEYMYTPPAEATYDGSGTKLDTTLVGDAASRFKSMIGNTYAEKTDAGYKLFIELKSANILSTFTINGAAPTVVKEETESNTKLVAVDVKDVTTALAVEAAVMYAPTNISTFTIELAAPKEETPSVTTNKYANGFYTAQLAFDSETGNSFIEQQSQVFFVNDVAYVQLAVKKAGIEYINVNGEKQTPNATMTQDKNEYNVYIIQVNDVTKPLSIDLSVNIPGVYEKVYKDLQLAISDVTPAAHTAFTHAADIVKPVTAAPEKAITVLLLTHKADAPITHAAIQKVKDGVQFTVKPKHDRLVKITSKDGKKEYYKKQARAALAESPITFTASTVDDVAFVYTDAQGNEQTATVDAVVTTTDVIDVETVVPVTPEEAPSTSTPELPSTGGGTTTNPAPPSTGGGTTTNPAPPSTGGGTTNPAPPSTGGGTTNPAPPSTGGGTAVQTEDGTYSASISFGPTGDSFLKPTATVIKQGNTYKVRVVVQGSDTIRSLSVGNSTKVADGVYEFTTSSLSSITATMHVVIPEASYDHTYTNVAVTLSIGSKTSNDTTFPAPPATDGSVTIPPSLGGNTQNPATPAPPTTETKPDDEKEEEVTTPEDGEQPTTEENTEEEPTTDEEENEVVEEQPAETMPFTDVSGEYVPYVQALYTAGITTGTTATTFAPQANMTRAQFAVMIARALDLSTKLAAAFTDIQGKWYAQDVQALAEVGIVTGKTASTFEPGATLTRQQAAVMLYRVLTYSGYTSTATTPTFSDTAKISDYAKPAFATLQQIGILTGDGNEAKPAQELTRGQMAKLLYLTLQVVNDL